MVPGNTDVNVRGIPNTNYVTDIDLLTFVNPDIGTTCKGFLVNNQVFTGINNGVPVQARAVTNDLYGTTVNSVDFTTRVIVGTKVKAIVETIQTELATWINPE